MDGEDLYTDEQDAKHVEGRDSHAAQRLQLAIRGEAGGGHDGVPPAATILQSPYSGALPRRHWKASLNS